MARNTKDNNSSGFAVKTTNGYSAIKTENTDTPGKTQANIDLSLGSIYDGRKKNANRTAK